VSGEGPRTGARGGAEREGAVRDGTGAEPPSDEPPPILARWSRLYALVLIELAACVALGLWLTRAFR